MVRTMRLILLILILTTSASLAFADVVLLDGRVDRQEITEVRFTVPAGCVLTGLGFRAHYDNITTMHCRYNRLMPNGTLAEPEEVQLGSEPENPCEAKVMLPDGWVAVGYGAAGEPEWDVTLLRVWARKLNPDGTLGELQEFNDGFNPTRGPERYVLLTETDRALTGAGLRFHSNDVIGVYGRSERIVKLDEQARTALKGLKISGRLVDGLDGVRSQKLLADMKKNGIRRLDIRLGTLPALPNSEMPLLSALTAASEKAAVETYLWTAPVRAEAIAGLFQRARALTGIVLDLSLPCEESLSPQYLESVLDACKSADRKLFLRIADYDASLFAGMPKEVGVILPTRMTGTLPKAGDLKGRQVLADIEISMPAALASNLPDVRIEQTAGGMVQAAIAGARSFIVNVQSGDGYLPEGVNSIALDAAKRLVRDPLQSTDRLWDSLCRSRYRDGADQAKLALQYATSANDLVFAELGIRILWEGGALASVPEVRARLAMLAGSADEDARKAAESLLEPSDQVADTDALENETSLWLIRQCLGAAGEVQQASPGANADALTDGVNRLQAAAQFSGYASNAFMRLQLYALDGAPSTRSTAQQALDALPKAGQEAASILGSDSPMLQGLRPFIYSARKALDEAAETSPIAIAFGHVRRLTAEGKDDDAAAALQQAMTKESFVPHLNKHWLTIGELATSLRAISAPDSGLRILWGGDGRWRLERSGGEWSIVTHEDGSCVYLDVPGEPLDPPADYVLSFEYYDEGDWQVHFQYDSDYTPEEQRQYHPVEPLQLTNTRTWKQASFTPTNALFSSSQNMEADMRFLSGKGARIRNVRLAPK